MSKILSPEEVNALLKSHVTGARPHLPTEEDRLRERVAALLHEADEWREKSMAAMELAERWERIARLLAYKLERRVFGRDAASWIADAGKEVDLLGGTQTGKAGIGNNADGPATRREQTSHVGSSPTPPANCGLTKEEMARLDKDVDDYFNLLDEKGTEGQFAFAKAPDFSGDFWCGT